MRLGHCGDRAGLRETRFVLLDDNVDVDTLFVWKCQLPFAAVLDPLLEGQLVATGFLGYDQVDRNVDVGSRRRAERTGLDELEALIVAVDTELSIGPSYHSPVMDTPGLGDLGTSLDDGAIWECDVFDERGAIAGKELGGKSRDGK